MMSPTPERPRPVSFGHPLSLAVGVVVGAALVFALARGSAPTRVTTQGLAPAAEQQETRTPAPTDAECAAQTWPYIEKGCAGRTSVGPRPPSVRIIAPDRVRSADAVAPPNSTNLALAPPEPLRATVGASAAAQPADLGEPAVEPPDLARVEPDRTVGKRGGRQARRTARAARVAERRPVVVLTPPGRAGIVAEGSNYWVRRVYLVPRDGVN